MNREAEQFESQTLSILTITKEVTLNHSCCAAPTSMQYNKEHFIKKIFGV